MASNHNAADTDTEVHPHESRRTSWPATVVVLTLLMLYTVVLLWLGRSTRVCLASAAALCGLARSVVHRTGTGPQPPPL